VLQPQPLSLQLLPPDKLNHLLLRPTHRRTDSISFRRGSSNQTIPTFDQHVEILFSCLCNLA
jgi:hypothetical protein